MWLNSIKISMKTLTMLNPKEKNIVFSSIQFNLRIWIELNSNSIELRLIQIALCKFIQCQIIQMKLNFNIMTLVDMCSVFLRHLTRHNSLANLEQEVYHKETSGYPWPSDTVKSPVSLNLVHVLVFSRNFYLFYFLFICVFCFYYYFV